MEDLPYVPTKKWTSEEELALVVINYLKNLGYKIYPEINGIDIVATKENNIIGIECKKHFNLKVLDQAYKNTKYLNQTWIAVGAGSKNNENFGTLVAKQNNIGVLIVSKHMNYEKIVSYKIKEHNVPIINLISNNSVKELIHPDAQNYAKAGQSGGKHWTPFILTITKLKEYVAKNPGCKLSEAVDNIDHHYSNKKSAVNCLSSFIGNVIKEIENKNGFLHIK